jgi:hypothetical protein
VQEEYQMRVDFTITRKLNDLIKEIPSVSGIVVGNSSTAGVLAAGSLWQFVPMIFKPRLSVQGV